MARDDFAAVDPSIITSDAGGLELLGEGDKGRGDIKDETRWRPLVQWNELTLRRLKP